MADNQRFAQLQTFRLAGAGSTIGDTTLLLTSFQTIDGTNLTMSDFGTYGYGTIQPDGAVFEEQIRFSGITQNANGTATLTGVSSIGFVYPYTVTANITKSHPGGASFVISNTAAFYDQLASKINDETITGLWSFPSSEIARPRAIADTDTAILAAYVTFGQLGRTSFAGTVDASTIQKGIVEIAIDAENGTGTGTGGTGAILVAAASSHNYISTTPSKIPVGRASDGKIDNSWGGTASSLATLNGSIKVVEDPANAQTTSAAAKIPLADVNGEIGMSWINYNMIYGDGSDGNVTLGAGTTTLTRDMFYNNLTIPNGSVLDPAGYYVFVKGTLTQQGNGKIARNGNNGGAGTAAVTTTAGTGGTAGSALSTNTLFGGNAGVAGGTGGTWIVGTSGITGGNANGTTITAGLGVTGAAGGTGGTGGSGGGGSTPGAGGTGTGGGITNLLNTRITDPAQARIMGMFKSGTFYSIRPNGQNGGGGGGSPGTSDGGGNVGGSGGGGGGSGSDGGVLVCFVKNIILSGGGNLFEVVGGNGGNGGSGGNASAGTGGGGGGGGGGSGGGGGLIIIVYKNKSAAITYSIAGGAAGTGAAGGTGSGGGANGATGSNGTAGVSGIEYEIQMSN